MPENNNEFVIVYPDSHNTPIRDLDIGESFLYEGMFHMVVLARTAKRPSETCPAIDLTTGHMLFIKENVPVTPIKKMRFKAFV